MKKMISFLLTLSFGLQSLAECDYSKIVKNDDGTLIYSKELHICVGQMKQDLSISKAQNDKYLQALTLKDLAITKSDTRADLWQASTFKLEDRINAIDSMRSTNNWMYFGLGALTIVAAGFTLRQAYGR